MRGCLQFVVISRLWYAWCLGLVADYCWRLIYKMMKNGNIILHKERKLKSIMV